MSSLVIRPWLGAGMLIALAALSGACSRQQTPPEVDRGTTAAVEADARSGANPATTSAAPDKPKTQADKDAEVLGNILRGPPQSEQDTQQQEQASNTEEDSLGKDPLQAYRTYLDNDRLGKEYAAAAQWFFERHPTDPRRWSFIVQSGFLPPQYIIGRNEKFDSDPKEENLIYDDAARRAAKTRQHRLVEQLLASKEVPEAVVGGGLGWLTAEAMTLANASPTTANLDAARNSIEKLIQKFPEHESTAMSVAEYATLLETHDPALARAYQAQIAARKIPAVIAFEKSRQEQMRLVSELASFKFTAMDGRVIDVSQMRGKVVLMDFWATWCGPCIAEMPNIKQVYSELHDQGFEVVAVTLDEEKNRAKVEKFVKRHQLPWPQYFDGKGMEGRGGIAEKFKITSIPAMFLLDRTGKVAGDDARGPKLRSEVQRLLAQPT